MENAGVITFLHRTFENAEVYANWNKWAKASMAPLLMSSGHVLGIEGGFTLDEKLIYRRTISINYYQDMVNYILHSRSPQRQAWAQDIRASWAEHIEESWRTVYFLIRSISGTGLITGAQGEIVDKTTRYKEFLEGSEPIILLKGLGLSPDDWEKYDEWVNEWGYDVYIPLLLKAPGITGYSRYWLSNVGLGGLTPRPGVSENPENPQDLSIIRFENVETYRNFLKSKELAAFEKNLSTAFPNGLNYKWDVACRLTRRWSK